MAGLLYIVPCLKADQRSNKLIGLRSSTYNPDHRFFLALLLKYLIVKKFTGLLQNDFPMNVRRHSL